MTTLTQPLPPATCPPLSDVQDDLILTEIAAGVLTITLNRPAKKNALTGAMYTALAGALNQAAGGPEVRVAVIRGSGGSFTAGNDLGDFLADPPTDENSPVFQFLRALASFPLPLIAAVEGPAVGVGTTLLLHCDLAYAAPSARFRLPFVDLGVVPEAASSYLLPRTVGSARANELLLLGEPFSAHDARRMGLINAVVDDPATHAAERAAVIAAKPPEAVRLTKALLRADRAGPVDAAMREEGRLFIERLASEEAQEALVRFVGRR
jgi:enoyl-CoA hydratase/carnithine racemase